MSLARASFLSLGVRAASVALGVGVTVLLARVLGPESYGGYLYLLNIALLLVIPVLMGVPVLVTRQIAAFRAQRRYGSITGVGLWALGFTGATAVAVLVLTFGVNAVLGLVEPALLPVLAALVLLTAAQRLATAVLYGYETPVRAVLSEAILRPSIHFALIAALAVAGALTIAGTFAAYALGLAAAIGFACWHIAGLYRPTRSSTGRLLARIDHRVWLASIGALGAISIAATINAKLDIVLLGYIATKTEVAVYGVALQIIGMVALVRNTILGVAGPRFSGLWARGDKKGVLELVAWSNRLTVAGALVMAVALYFVAEPILTWLIGEAFSDSAALAMIASLNILFISVMGPSPVLLTMCGYESFFLRASLAMMALNIVLNLMLIPLYGAFGALAASLASEALFQVTCAVFCRCKLGISTIGVLR